MKTTRNFISRKNVWEIWTGTSFGHIKWLSSLGALKWTPTFSNVKWTSAFVFRTVMAIHYFDLAIFCTQVPYMMIWDPII